MNYSEQMKIDIFQGLGELANFKLTQDSEISFSNLLTQEAATIINENWELIEHKQPLRNSYLIKSRIRFLNALKTALKISQIKLGLNSLLIDSA